MNTLTSAELKRRGIAAIEEGLLRGPLHLVKRNKPTAVVISEEDFARLTRAKPGGEPVGLSAVQWLLGQPSRGRRTKAQIDKALRDERDAWS